MRKGVLLTILTLGVAALGARARAAEKEQDSTKAAATHCTRHFEVTAPTERIARQVGESAERLLRDIARRWLGEQLPPWPQRCPIRVKITLNGSGGTSTFLFDRGSLLSHSVELEGTLETLLTSALPHEITHAVLAYHFRRPVPRWADEGISILSESGAERRRHAKLVRKILADEGRPIPLARLFTLTQYPRDVMVLYAEGASVARFLLERKDRRTLLAFVRDGLDRGWDAAARAHYGLADVGKLEAAWLKWLREDAVEPP